MANDKQNLAPDALSGAAIFSKAISVGETKAAMPRVQSFVLAVLAGFFIGMGGMFMLLVKSDATLSFAASSLLGGLAFSLGLFAVLVAGAELFTGNNLMIQAALSGKYSLGKLLVSWAVVYLGNFCGALSLVGLLQLADFGAMNGGAVATTVLNVAAAKCNLSVSACFGRAIMCNILVCLAVWMGFASRTVVDKFLVAVVPVVAFVACGFEHCVANMFFLPMGLFTLSSIPSEATGAAASAITAQAISTNLVVATLGNILGGAVLFAGTYWLAYRKQA